MLLATLVNNLREVLKKSVFMQCFFGVRHNIHYSLSASIESLTRPNIFNKEMYPHRAATFQNGLRRTDLRVFHIANYQPRTFPVTGVLVLQRQESYLRLCLVYLTRHMSGLSLHPTSLSVYGITSFAQQDGLPTEDKSRGNNRPCSNSFGPAYEMVPPWQVVVSVLSFLAALFVLVGSIRNERGAVFLAVSLVFFGGVMLLAGHEYYGCDGKPYRGPDYPLPQTEQFLHNKENVSQKPLTYTVYL